VVEYHGPTPHHAALPFPAAAAAEPRYVSQTAEAALLSAPFGSAQRQALVNASWRSEALAVVGWALQRSSLPARDTQGDPSLVADELGFLKDRTVLDLPRLRTAAELADYSNVAFSVHWRLRDFSINPRHLDFADFRQTAWFGPLNLQVFISKTVISRWATRQFREPRNKP